MYCYRGRTLPLTQYFPPPFYGSRQPATVSASRPRPPVPARRVPERIWTFWHRDEIPEFIAACMSSMIVHHPDWTVENQQAH